MPKTLVVNLTEPIIERATQADSRHCMIAEAIQEAYPDAHNILVDLQTIRWSQKGRRYLAITPEFPAQLLVDFDQGRPIEPARFRIVATQITKSIRNTESRPEARAAGRKYRRKTEPSRKRSIAKNLTVQGGRSASMPRAALSAGVGSVNVPREAEGGPPEDASNVLRSNRRFRQYGMRLLKG